MADVNSLRVMLVDGSPAFLRAAADFLGAEPKVEIVAECATGGDAVAQIRDARPHLVLVDIMLPGMNGLDTTRLLKAHAPGVCVVLLSLYDTEGFRDGARQAGAEAFFSKAQFGIELPPFVQKLAR